MGNYLIRMTRGPEYDLVERRVTVAPGQTVDVQTNLHRTVDTTGWISTDYHSHSSPSGDNHCNTYDRIINFAAEQLEFIPTTEHNRIYDWQPYIDELGLGDLLRTVAGIELTGQGQHFNSFPLEYSPLTQDGGAPAWQYDPRLNAIVLRNASSEADPTAGSRPITPLSVTSSTTGTATGGATAVSWDSKSSSTPPRSGAPRS